MKLSKLSPFSSLQVYNPSDVWDRLTRDVIGFEDFAKEFFNSPTTLNTNYPPYNLVKQSDTEYTIELAVAGFDESELSVDLAGDSLTVSGKKEKAVDDSTFMYRGISARAFTRSWRLAEGIEIKDVSLENGMLTINLKRKAPEAEKTTKIAITTKKSR